jgi:hypothetical protein
MTEYLPLDERQQIRIDHLGMRGAHAMGKSRIDLQRSLRQQLRRLQRSCTDGHDLIVVPMQYQHGNIDPLSFSALWPLACVYVGGQDARVRIGTQSGDAMGIS